MNCMWLIGGIRRWKGMIEWIQFWFWHGVEVNILFMDGSFLPVGWNLHAIANLLCTWVGHGIHWKNCLRWMWRFVYIYIEKICSLYTGKNTAYHVPMFFSSHILRSFIVFSFVCLGFCEWKWIVTSQFWCIIMFLPFGVGKLNGACACLSNYVTEPGYPCVFFGRNFGEMIGWLSKPPFSAN